jgi:hypothetical protein
MPAAATVDSAKGIFERNFCRQSSQFMETMLRPARKVPDAPRIGGSTDDRFGSEPTPSVWWFPTHRCPRRRYERPGDRHRRA